MGDRSRNHKSWKRNTHIHNVCVRCLDVDCDWKCYWRDRRTYFARPIKHVHNSQTRHLADTNYILKHSRERILATGSLSGTTGGFLDASYRINFPAAMISAVQCSEHIASRSTRYSKGRRNSMLPVHHYHVAAAHNIIIHRIIHGEWIYRRSILSTPSHARYTHSCWYHHVRRMYGDAYMSVLLSNMSTPMAIKAWDLPWSGLGNWVVPFVF